MVDLEVTFDETLEIEAPVEKVYDLVSDYKRSAKLVPGVKKFTHVKGEVYRWEHHPVGAKGFAIAAKYDTEFSSKKNKEVRWRSIEGSGNTDVDGVFNLKKGGGGTTLSLSLRLTAHLPIPRLARFIAQPILEAQTRKVMGEYLERLRGELVG